ncbi:MAG: 5-bromo-4-chloroindolyl phosphate hydrolysis family protein [Clostridia bacterium]|nr:5-bromo-4-chloroindolyl phosphate hydrolysis family protein [Clostridia bacterium]
MKKNKKKQKSGLGAGLIAFGAAYAAYSAVFKPHSIGAYALAFALSGFLGAIVRVMAQGLDTTQNQKTPESLQKVQGDTGNPEVDELLEQGREMIAEIRRENDLIPDDSLSGKLDILENKCAEIFRAVYDKPNRASQIRKFMDYYLPTTLKMVKGYRMLDERGITGQDAIYARNRIDDALLVVLQGCEKMLDKLYQDDVLDLTTDIDVLEQMLKRDGLSESDLDIAAAQAKRAAQIDAAANRIARERAYDQQKQQPVQQTAAPKWNIDPRFSPDGQAQMKKPDEQ